PITTTSVSVVGRTLSLMFGASAATSTNYRVPLPIASNSDRPILLIIFQTTVVQTSICRVDKVIPCWDRHCCGLAQGLVVWKFKGIPGIEPGKGSFELSGQTKLASVGGTLQFSRRGWWQLRRRKGGAAWFRF